MWQGIYKMIYIHYLCLTYLSLSYISPQSRPFNYETGTCPSCIQLEVDRGGPHLQSWHWRDTGKRTRIHGQPRQTDRKPVLRKTLPHKVAKPNLTTVGEDAHTQTSMFRIWSFNWPSLTLKFPLLKQHSQLSMSPMLVYEVPPLWSGHPCHPNSIKFS